MQQLFELRKGDQRVAIDDAVYDVIIEAARAVGKTETGGILIGRYEGNALALVEHATVAPADSRRGYDWFERGTKGLEEVLQQHWQDSVRRYYVGEWHYHPAPDGSPSPQDVAQMFQVASDRLYECTQPILIIVALDDDGAWLFRIFLIVDDGMHELTLTRDG